MITTYQIRNVLRVYSSNLKKKSTQLQESVKNMRQPDDMVDISMGARRKQMLNRMSNKLISKITPKKNKDESIKDNSKQHNINEAENRVINNLKEEQL